MKQNRNSAILCLLAVVTGLAMLITGIVFLSGFGSYYSTDSITSTSFGADFYTYEFRATRIAAQNAAATAHYVRDMAQLVARCAGAALIFGGILVILAGLLKLNSLISVADLLLKKTAAAQPAPVTGAAPAETPAAEVPAMEVVPAAGPEAPMTEEAAPVAEAEEAAADAHASAEA